MKIIKIDANELKEILGKVYDNIFIIKGIDIADASNQSTPDYKVVDAGGILTLHVEINDEIKE